MAHYKMKFFGSLQDGDITKHFDKDEVVEFKTNVHESLGEKVDAPKEEKKNVEVAGKEVETAAKEPKAEKRKRK